MMATKALSKPIPDKQLSFHQVMIAKSLLMEHMAAQGWPETHVYALAEFFLKMEGHKLRRLPFREAAVIIYQAEVRREWHDALSSSESSPTFNIRFINEERLDRTRSLLISQDAINKAQSISIDNPLTDILFPTPAFPPTAFHLLLHPLPATDLDTHPTASMHPCTHTSMHP